MTFQRTRLRSRRLLTRIQPDMVYRYIWKVYILILYFQNIFVFCHIKDLGETNFEFNEVVKLIGGGIPAPLKSFPFNVQFFNKGGICSASILSKKTVLTAAHCFDFNKNIGEMTVLSGSQMLLDRHRQQHPVWDFRTHPQYNTEALFSDDVAIVLIHDEFVFSPDVQPAVLSNTESWMRENETTFVATGWGATSPGGGPSLQGLMETTLQYVSRKECMKIYEGVPFSADMFCLYGNGTSDTCKGDSGGGILWKNMIVGIVSHGFGCMTHPGVYVNVFYFSDWIKNATDELYKLYCRFHAYG